MAAALVNMRGLRSAISHQISLVKYSSSLSGCCGQTGRPALHTDHFPVQGTMAGFCSAACLRSSSLIAAGKISGRCRPKVINSPAQLGNSVANRSIGQLMVNHNVMTMRSLHSCDTSKLIFLRQGGGRYNFKCLSTCAKRFSTEKSIKGSSQKSSITDEILKARTAAHAATQDAGPDVKATGGETSGRGSESKQDKPKGWRVMFSKEHAWKVGLIFLGGTAGIIGLEILFLWGKQEIGEDGNLIEDEFSNLPKWQAYPRRALRQMKFYKKLIEEPSSQKLLPDPLKEPFYQPPYTLVLEMTGILVHPDWTIGTGWRFKKRPGVDYFLQQVGPPLFEIVIYTHEQGFTAYPIIDGLDPNGHIMYRLFRDATRYLNGTHVKDLACLNRDLSKVIIIDCDQKAFSLHPQNAFLLKKWSGDDKDRTLIDLAAFLRMLASSEVEDVRGVLEYYSQFDDPIGVFKEKQRQLQEQQELARQTKDQNKNQALAGRWSYGLSGRKTT